MSTILVVEDDQLFSKVVKEWLESEGYDVLISESVDKAKGYMNSTKIDLVLLDLKLPGKDGFILLRDLKRDTKTNNIPVVIISNQGQMGKIEHGQDLGAEDFIVKVTVDKQKLLEVVEKRLLRM